MIFVTVGSVTPFDRLIRCVDQWALHKPSVEVLAQIGHGEFLPQHCRYVRELVPDKYAQVFSSADLIVAHAGMGTIIKAVELNKPAILLPRLGRLRETRNDHQTATLKRFGHLSMISAAETEATLIQLLDEFAADPAQFARPTETPDSTARHSLVAFVRSFISPQE